MSRAVGVELTETSVRLLALENGGAKAKAVLFHQTPIPAGEELPWEDRAGMALKEAFAASKASRARVVAAVDSGHAILREVALPFKGEEQIRKTVRYELESMIHNYSIEQLVVSHYKIGDTDKGTVLLAAAVPKEVVARILRVFAKAGIDPVALDLDVCAVFNAMKHAGAVEAVAPHLLIYGTSKFTKLILVENGKPRSIRTIRFSLPAEGAPKAPPEETRGDSPILILESEDAPRFRELDAGAQAGLVGILAKEVSRFLLSQAATSSPSHILLAGDFEDEEAARQIGAATRIPVKTFKLLDAVEGAGIDGRSARVAAALGLALKGAGTDALGMDFRQEEFRYQKKYEALKTTALVAAELLVVLLAAVGLHLWFKRGDLRKANAWMFEQHRIFYEGLVGDELADPRQAYAKLSELYRKAGQQTNPEGPLVESGRTAWIELFGAVQRFKQKYAPQKLGGGDLYLMIDGVEIQQTTTSGNESLTLTLRGKIRNHEFAGVLKNEVRAAEVFAAADWSGPIVPIEGGLFQFTLKAVKSKAKRTG